MNKTLRTLIVLVLSLAIVGAVSLVVEDSRDKTVAARLRTVALKLSDGCPKPINEYTQLEKVKAGPGKLLAYYYLVNLDNFENFNFEAIKAEVETNYRTHELMKYMRDNEVTLRYVYSHPKGDRPVFQFEVR